MKDVNTEIISVKKGHSVMLQFSKDKEEVEEALCVEHGKNGCIKGSAIYGVTFDKVTNDITSKIVSVKKGHTVFLQFPKDKEEIQVVLRVEHGENGAIRYASIHGSNIDKKLQL